MEFKIYLKNYYLRLLKLPLFSILILLVYSCSIEVDNQTETVKVKEQIYNKEVFSFYESGKPKEINLYQNKKGEKELVGFEELHENGALRIRGKYNSKGQRVGKWESFYEDGTSWSIGEFANGVETGKKQTWYSNGKLRYEGQMENGKPIGKWVFKDEKGTETYKVY